MNFKLALAAAAVVGLAGTANAADLAKKAPAAANYVKVCDAYGAGFFYIPGSDTCLKIGGFVRAEYRVYGRTSAASPAIAGSVGWNTRNQNGITTRARADVNLDARTNTEMGLLRSYIDFWLTADSAGNGNANTQANGFVQPSVWLRKAFIQFGGLTAGRATSFFDFYTGSNANSVFHVAASDADINLLAYTFSFGNGISASLSIEDASTSDESNTAALGLGGRRLNGPYGGVKTPDLVANVNITQAWGSAQLMAALHDDYSSVAAGGIDKDKVGFAIGGGVKINLPMLAAGDVLGIQAAYSKGAMEYVNGGGWYSNAAWQDFYTGAGKIDQSTAWSVAAGLNHNWTPAISSALSGSYASFDAPAVAGAVDFKQYDLQGNVVWKPAKGLAISANVEYRYVDREAAVDGGAYVGFLRVQRDF
jgi:hypothetical protein